jgi:dihydrofolate reductase
MAASLDAFIARRDGSVDWLQTADAFAAGETMDPAFVAAFLKTIDCYVMGSRTYETAIRFEGQGSGWSYGDKLTFVLTSPHLPRVRDTVEFYSDNATPGQWPRAGAAPEGLPALAAFFLAAAHQARYKGGSHRQPALSAEQTP